MTEKSHYVVLIRVSGEDDPVGGVVFHDVTRAIEYALDRMNADRAVASWEIREGGGDGPILASGGRRI